MDKLKMLAELRGMTLNAELSGRKRVAELAKWIDSQMDGELNEADQRLLITLFRLVDLFGMTYPDLSNQVAMAIGQMHAGIIAQMQKAMKEAKEQMAEGPEIIGG